MSDTCSQMASTQHGNGCHGDKYEQSKQDGEPDVDWCTATAAEVVLL